MAWSCVRRPIDMNVMDILPCRGTAEAFGFGLSVGGKADGRAVGRQVPMFRNCEARTLIDLLECMAAKVYLPKEYILLEGSKGRHMCPARSRSRSRSRTQRLLPSSGLRWMCVHRYILLRGLCEVRPPAPSARAEPRGESFDSVRRY